MDFCLYRQCAVNDFNKDICDYTISKIMLKNIKKISNSENLFYKQVTPLINRNDKQSNEVNRKIGYICKLIRSES